MGRTSLIGVVATGIFLMTSAQALAVTVTLGRPTADLTVTGTTLVGCYMTTNCTQSLAQLAVIETGAAARAPADGKVVAWRVLGSKSGSSDAFVCPRVFHAAGSGQYTGGGQTPDPTSTCFQGNNPHLDGSTNALVQSIPIGIGDYVGVDVGTSNGSAVVAKTAPLGSSLATFVPELFGTPTTPTETDSFELMFNADVELDAPQITDAKPLSGPSAGGTSVTINGQHLASASAVTFGGTHGVITSNTNHQIVVTAPAHTGGDAPLQVSTPGGTASAGSFHYKVAPTITSVSPASGPASGGKAVTITGSHLSDATRVSFGATPSSTFSGNDTKILAIAPPHAPGLVDVRVTTPSGVSSTSSADRFRFTAVDKTPPVIRHLAVRPSTFKPANVGGPVVARVGGKVSYRLSERARVKFTVEKRRKKHHKIVWKHVKGSFSRNRPAGRDAFTFTARIAGHALKRGSYRLVAVARDRAGNRSARARAAFKVKP